MKTSVLIYNSHRPYCRYEISYKYDLFCGFEGEDVKTQSRRELDVLRSIYLSLLIHDYIYIPLSDFTNLVERIGVPSCIDLLESGAFKLIDDLNMSPSMLIEKKYCSFSIATGKGSEITYLEERLNKSPFVIRKDIIKLTNLCTDYLVNCDSEKFYDIISNEINTDLIINPLELELQSKNLEKIKIHDTFKILRLSNILMGFIHQIEHDITHIEMDGASAQYLNIKANYFLQKNSKDSISPFKKIINLKKIPDLSLLVQEKFISVSKLIELRNNIHGKIFRDWYHSSNYDMDVILSTLLVSNDKKPIEKLLRWIYPNLFGLISPISGIASSLIDSYLLDNLKENWNPNLYLDDVLKKEIDKRIQRKSSLYKETEGSSKFDMSEWIEVEKVNKGV